MTVPAAGISALAPSLAAELPGLARGERVVVAMSGGVDSSVAAALAVQAGLEVAGVTLRLGSPAQGGRGACCAGEDIRDARRVADSLGIHHYVLDFGQRFRETVIEDFIRTYAAGRTPVPCTRCNQWIKFRDLLEFARDLGASALLTGHYARRIEGRDGAELHRAHDPERDQSYFLHATSREQLAFVRFPLGGLPKAQTRQIAAQLGLCVARKPDSQDICFVTAGGYGETIRRLAPGVARPGAVVDSGGRVVGRHRGIIDFTIGQRRGLGGGASAPRHVIAIDPDSAEVRTGPRALLARDFISCGEMNWLLPAVPEDGMAVTVRCRSAQPETAGRVRARPGGRAGILLEKPSMAVAPGQACVLYQGSRVIGGGIIDSSRLVQKPAPPA